MIPYQVLITKRSKLYWLMCVVCLYVVGCSDLGFADQHIDLAKIKQIESHGNPNAYNPRTKAIGLYQITPICLADWNQYHAKQRYLSQDLYDPEINAKIADWYLRVRIPQMLRYYRKEVTVRNVLICYNAGIKYVVRPKPLPKETVNYIAKYQRR